MRRTSEKPAEKNILFKLFQIYQYEISKYNYIIFQIKYQFSHYFQIHLNAKSSCEESNFSIESFEEFIWFSN